MLARHSAAIAFAAMIAAAPALAQEFKGVEGAIQDDTTGAFLLQGDDKLPKLETVNGTDVSRQEHDFQGLSFNRPDFYNPHRDRLRRGGGNILNLFDTRRDSD